MKGILEKEEIGRRIDRETRYAYALTAADLDEMGELRRNLVKALGAAYYAGFYAGISCAINRGYNKKNDPRKANSHG